MENNRRSFFKGLAAFASGVVAAKVASYTPKKEEKKAAESVSLEKKQEMLSDYMKKIDDILSTSSYKEKFIAVGECGLDYDRFEYADKET